MKMEKKMKQKNVVEKKPKQGNGKVMFSIRLQLVIGFVIPVLFVILTGSLSYTMASAGLQENYESSAYTALDMTMNSFDESMKTVSAVVLELAQDQTVNAYALGGYDSDVAKQNQAETSITNNINVKQTSTQMIEGIHVIPVSTDYLVTSKNLGASLSLSVMEPYCSRFFLSQNRYASGSPHEICFSNALGSIAGILDSV